MRAAPIPRSLLPHTILHYYGKPAQDNDGNVTWPSSREVKWVRIDPSGRLVSTMDNTEIRLSGLMFYDERNSAPRGAVFAVGDRVEWNGKPYRVETAEMLYDGARPHHQEVGLV